MKKIFPLYMVLIFSLMIISCGGKKAEDQQKAQAQAKSESPARANNEPARSYPKGTLSKDDVIATNPDRKNEAVKKPSIPKGSLSIPENMQEGTCEYAAYWFAEYFTSGDSLKAYELCNDSMKNIVRQILQNPGQIKTMQLNRQAGYQLDGVSLANESTDKYARVCLQATFMEETREDCNFYFEKIDGQWLLCGFKK